MAMYRWAGELGRISAATQLRDPANVRISAVSTDQSNIVTTEDGLFQHIEVAP